MALKHVLIIFENPNFNYVTSVNGRLDDSIIKDYFIGKHFNIAPYPNEVLRLCVNAQMV